MAKTAGRGGFPSIFRNKRGGKRYQGNLTKVGSAAFEEARKRLAKLAGRKSATDADVMEYLSRGEAETRAYLIEHGTD